MLSLARQFPTAGHDTCYCVALMFGTAERAVFTRLGRLATSNPPASRTKRAVTGLPCGMSAAVSDVARNPLIC